MWNPFKKEEEDAQIAEHECDYKIVASHNEKKKVAIAYYRDDFSSPSGVIDEDWFTHLLYKCDCGKWKNEYINGKWSKADIKKLEKKDTVDIKINTPLYAGKLDDKVIDRIVEGINEAGRRNIKPI